MRGTIVRVRIGLSVRAEVVGDSGKLIEGGLQILGDLFGDHIRFGEACGVLEALVPEPEKVKVDLVALDQVFVVVGAPAAIRGFLAPARSPVVTYRGVVSHPHLTA